MLYIKPDSAKLREKTIGIPKNTENHRKLLEIITRNKKKEKNS